jgi:hypothetical protein
MSSSATPCLRADSWIPTPLSVLRKDAGAEQPESDASPRAGSRSPPKHFSSLSTISLLYTSVAGLVLKSGQRLASTQRLNVSPRRQATTPRVRCGGKGDPSAVGGRGNPSAGLRAIDNWRPSVRSTSVTCSARSTAPAVYAARLRPSNAAPSGFGCEGQKRAGGLLRHAHRLEVQAVRQGRGDHAVEAAGYRLQPSSSARNAAALRAVTTSGQVAIRNRSSSPRIAHVDGEAENRRSRVRIL